MSKQQIWDLIRREEPTFADFLKDAKEHFGEFFLTEISKGSKVLWQENSLSSQTKE